MRKAPPGFHPYPTVKELRAAFDLSRRDLARAMEHEGHPSVSDQVITRLEEGRMAKEKTLLAVLAVFNRYARENNLPEWTIESIDWLGSDIKYRFLEARRRGIPVGVLRPPNV